MARTRQRKTASKAAHATGEFEQGSSPRYHTPFVCQEPGREHGAIVGCCHECGRLLCEEHVHHLTKDDHFGPVSGIVTYPLVCHRHRTRHATPGAPDARVRARSAPIKATTRLRRLLRRTTHRKRQ